MTDMRPPRLFLVLWFGVLFVVLALGIALTFAVRQ